MTGLVRVLVVDDQPSFLRAAARSLAADPALDVVRAVGSASAAITALEEGLEVDIALIDLSMPEMNGLEAIAWIHRCYPDIVSVLMSTYEPDELPASARSLDVAYLRKADLSAERVVALARAGSLPDLP